MVKSITLQTSDNDIIANDNLGTLAFAASNESSGADALFVSASIDAVAESEFTSISNATSLVFSTASSETATPKIQITSQGHILPYSTNTNDIGSSGLSFRNGYFQNVKVNNLNVSVSGHTHTSSDITNFNSSVSGLLPVKNIVAGTNVTVTSVSGTYTINSTGGGGGSSASIYILTHIFS